MKLTAAEARKGAKLAQAKNRELDHVLSSIKRRAVDEAFKGSTYVILSLDELRCKVQLIDRGFSVYLGNSDSGRARFLGQPMGMMKVYEVLVEYKQSYGEFNVRLEKMCRLLNDEYQFWEQRKPQDYILQKIRGQIFDIALGGGIGADDIDVFMSRILEIVHSADTEEARKSSLIAGKVLLSWREEMKIDKLEHKNESTFLGIKGEKSEKGDPDTYFSARSLRWISTGPGRPLLKRLFGQIKDAAQAGENETTIEVKRNVSACEILVEGRKTFAFCPFDLQGLKSLLNLLGYGFKLEKTEAGSRVARCVLSW